RSAQLRAARISFRGLDRLLDGRISAAVRLCVGIASQVFGSSMRCFLIGLACFLLFPQPVVRRGHVEVEVREAVVLTGVYEFRLGALIVRDRLTVVLLGFCE